MAQSKTKGATKGALARSLEGPFLAGLIDRQAIPIWNWRSSLSSKSSNYLVVPSAVFSYSVFPSHRLREFRCEGCRRVAHRMNIWLRAF